MMTRVLRVEEEEVEADVKSLDLKKILVRGQKDPEDDNGT